MMGSPAQGFAAWRLAQAHRLGILRFGFRCLLAILGR